jgi:predicted GNAT family acetyltransferase
MHEEEMGEDPFERDPSGFRRRTASQVDRGRSWLWEEGGTILFKAEASACTSQAIQLQQVWVDPSVRGQGYAKCGMRDLCRLLLKQAPRICLFVRTDNTPAIRVYEAIGMRRAMTYRSIVF